MLSLSHVLADGFVSFHVTLMPLLAKKLGLSAAAAGLAVSVMSIPANFGQPVVGHLFERRSQKRLMCAGLLLAVAGASVMGLAWSFPALLVILVAGGLGLAFYHPTSGALVAAVSTGRRGMVTSFWSASGGLGVMLGPMLIGLWVQRRGLEATPWAMVIGLPLALPIMFGVRDRARLPVHEASTDAVVPTRPGAFALLTAQTILRSLTISAFLTYISFYCQSEDVGMSPAQAGVMTGIFSIMGASGALLGGLLSDHVPRKPIMALTVLAAPAALLVFVLWPSVQTAAALGVGGMLVWAGHTVTIVLGQEYMPRNTSAASGVIIGGAWGVGTLTMPFWGKIADLYGYRTTLIAVLLTAPVLAGVLALLQPHTDRPTAAERAG